MNLSKKGMISLYNVMGIIWRWKNSINMLEIDILRNSSQKFLGVLRGAFSVFGCPKRHPNALLAKTMLGAHGKLFCTPVYQALALHTTFMVLLCTGFFALWSVFLFGMYLLTSDRIQILCGGGRVYCPSHWNVFIFWSSTYISIVHLSM